MTIAPKRIREFSQFVDKPGYTPLPVFRHSQTFIEEVEGDHVWDGSDFKIRIGINQKNENYNLDEIITGETTELERRPSWGDKGFYIPFSNRLDEDDMPQSESLIQLGMVGSGKTNTLGVFIWGFFKRPTKKTVLVISHKYATVMRSFQTIGERLEERYSAKTYYISFGGANPYRIPFDFFDVKDVVKWFNMSAEDERSFSRYFSRADGNTHNAMLRFLDTPKGKKYQDFWEDMMTESRFIAMNKSQTFSITQNSVYFLDLDSAFQQFSDNQVDVIVSKYCAYFLKFVKEKRQETFEKYKELEAKPPAKEIWQGMIAFDEYGDLVQSKGLRHTIRRVDSIGSMARQEGMSLFLSAQSRYGWSNATRTLFQAAHILHYRASDKTDTKWVCENMFGERSSAAKAAQKICEFSFPQSKDSNSHVGKVVYFSKKTNSVVPVRIIPFETLSESAA